MFSLIYGELKLYQGALQVFNTQLLLAEICDFLPKPVKHFLPNGQKFEHQHLPSCMTSHWWQQLSIEI